MPFERVDEYEARDVAPMVPCEQSRDQPAVGVRDDDVRARDSRTLEQRVELARTVERRVRRGRYIARADARAVISADASELRDALDDRPPENPRLARTLLYDDGRAAARSLVHEMQAMRANVDEPAERREAERLGALAERLEQPAGGEQHEQRAENDRESQHRRILIWRSFRFYASHGSRPACHRI